MRSFSFFRATLLVIVLFLILTGQSVFAQIWMEGYNFRKTITIDKSKVSGTLNLLNFNVLIALQSEELKYLLGCKRSIQQNTGLPISFALKNKPAVPIGFQVDSYDPVAGTLYCWVQIAELIAGGSPGLNEIYFYYGGNARHYPLSEESRGIWYTGYQQVWHMDFDAFPAVSFSAFHSAGNHAIGSQSMNAASFVTGVVGTATSFNGATDVMYAAIDTNRKISISGWIMLAQSGAEQVILTNDSAGNGYRVKINAQGKLVFEIHSSGAVNTHTAIDPLPVNTWVYMTVLFNGRLKRIYLNGVYKGGGVSPAPKKDTGGAIAIGGSKQNEHYFHGLIDELRMANVERTLDWVVTEYRNQQNPMGFISVSAQEINTVQTPNENEFTGAAGTDNWDDELNWSFGSLPNTYSNVVVKGNKQVQINAGTFISVNRLTLERGARLVLESPLEVNCTAQIDHAATLLIKRNVRLIFRNDVVNHGSILDQNNGILSLQGNELQHNFSGSGITKVSDLEVSQSLPGHVVLLHAKLEVSSQLVLKKGVLNSNGQLTLLTNGYNNYAVVLPFDINSAGIIGKVHVQQFIDGAFLSPSTARGWWLLSSPVYHSAAVPKQYDFNAVQKSIFVTGPGGTTNGFDPSPNNNSTIYIHDQGLPGTLSQKYSGIPDMWANINLGKGFYVFSRGSRLETDAFEQQILKAPFSNPKAYVITHTGELFTGDLKVEVFNRNTNALGDGYNLLGNPYASPITWGSLKKVNVSAFIWVFDPKNNAYLVTDDPEYIIHAGTGFFVRVNTGSNAGEVTFTEASKYSTPADLIRSKGLAFAGKQGELNAYHLKTTLKVKIKKDSLQDAYVLVLQRDGHDEITDADALKIGEGHLSISGLTTSGVKLAIDERRIDTGRVMVPLFVKGWTSGAYSLSLRGDMNNKEEVTLMDHYLDKQIVITQNEQRYHFFIDMVNKDTYGGKRFSLLVKPLENVKDIEEKDKSVLLYPNPVSDVSYIRSLNQTWRNLKALIRKIDGNIVWSGELPLLEPGTPAQLPFNQFMKGLYILQLIDSKSNRTIAVFKVLKN